MKFWELQSVACCARDQDSVRAVAVTDPDWADFASWCDAYSAIVAGQDRAKLDFELPDAFCRAVLARLDLPYYLSDKTLRSRPQSDADLRLSALEAYDRFGGHAIEDAQEKGSWPVGGFQ